MSDGEWTTTMVCVCGRRHLYPTSFERADEHTSKTLCPCGREIIVTTQYTLSTSTDEGETE